MTDVSSRGRTAGAGGDHAQPAAAAHPVHRPRARACRLRAAARRHPASDADRHRRRRQDAAGDPGRRRDRVESSRTGSGSSTWRRSPTRPESWRLSPACSASARARTRICEARSARSRQRPAAAAGPRQLRAPARGGRRPSSTTSSRPPAGLRVLATSREGLGVDGERLFAVRSLPAPPPSRRATPARGRGVRTRCSCSWIARSGSRRTSQLTDEQRGGRRRHLPPARRHPAGAGAGGRAREAALGRADSQPAGRSLPAADRRRRRPCRGSRRCRRRFSGATTSSPPTSSDCSARCRCSSAAGRSRSPTRVVDGRRRRVRDARPAVAAGGQVAGARRPQGRWRHALHPAGDGPPVRGRTADGAAATSAAVRRRHADAFLAIAERAYAERVTKEARWAALLATEHDNVRAALAFLRDNDPEKYLALAGALAWFWQARSYLLEGREHLTQALAASPATPARKPTRGRCGAAPIFTRCAATPRPRRR